MALKAYTHITNNDRVRIESMWRDGATVKEIAERIGTEITTIYRELKRGFDNTAIAPGRFGYSAEIAIRDAEEARARKYAAQRRHRNRTSTKKPRKAATEEQGEKSAVSAHNGR